MIDLFTQPLTIVDIETTGLHPVRDRIIEIAAIRIEKGDIVETFDQLINPEVSLSNEITLITGITNEHVRNAPRFFDIKDELKRFTHQSLFIAHNAGFDYGFIKNEFKRYEEQFNSKQLCTVKLFRSLVPTLPHYNLDSLLSYFRIDVTKRHRAFDDAMALWEFLNRAKQQFSPTIVNSSAATVMKRTSLPSHLTETDIDHLPQGPGVYLMYGDEPQPIYIGKSISIRDRVLSHFADRSNSTKEEKIAQHIRRIEYKETAGELSALLMESSLIKQYQPLYNRQLRKVQKMILAKEVTLDGQYSTVTMSTVDHIEPDILPMIVSVFRSKKQAETAFLDIAKKHSLCPVLLGIDHAKHGCFWQQLGWCKGACIGKESVASYNMRFALAFSKLRYKRWPFEGPILIKESSTAKHYGIIIDKWCILDTVEQENDVPDLRNLPYTFDTDTYKILARALFSPKQSFTITKLPPLDSQNNSFF